MLQILKDDMDKISNEIVTHISRVCSLHIFVAIFDGFTLLKTRIIFVCKKVVAEHMVSLFGE